ncbi:MAG: dihydroneopterin aldolase [Sneathiella sp.]|nr:dihydroneopterin aldolase [Sneathiella sp.]
MTSSDLSNVMPLPGSIEAVSTHQIFISDLVLDMSIGIYDHEKANAQRVRFNIEITARDSQAPLQDDYQNVLCYEAIVNSIKSLVADEHINLVETLAERVADICLSSNQAVKASVKVEKLDAIKEAGSVGVQIVRTKG